MFLTAPEGAPCQEPGVKPLEWADHATLEILFSPSPGGATVKSQGVKPLEPEARARRDRVSHSPGGATVNSQG